MTVDTALYRFRVTGVEEQTTYLPTHRHPFDETFEIAGEHPAEALEKLVRGEIEWGILDGYEPWQIEFKGEAAEPQPKETP